MKVSEIMQKGVESISSTASVGGAARVIFGKGINGLPVCKNKKLIGFITEQDILAKFFPTIKEYMDDPFHSSDFEGMEHNVREILNIKVEDIMTKDLVTVSGDMPLLKAQSLMSLRKIGRVPVVDGKGNLIGIVSKGDIFKAIVGNSLSLESHEGFYDWSAKLYDTMIDWKKRLSYEIPDIENILIKEGAQRVLDVASSTGEHSIALANKGFEVIGVEPSNLMVKLAQSKRSMASKNIQSKTIFLHGRYDETLKKIKSPVDAIIFMGNALPHIEYEHKKALGDASNLFGNKKSLMIFQIINFKKVLQNQGGLRDFTMIKDKAHSYYKSHSFLGFYTKKEKKVIYTRVIMSSTDDEKWIFRSINSTPIKEMTKDDMEKTLKELGFSHISFYGSNFYEPLFSRPFNENGDDWLNIVARR